MKFDNFDMRGAAETGQWLTLKQPNVPDGDPITSGKDRPCRVLVRGVASRTVQDQMRARQKARMTAMKGKKAEDEARVMEDIHDDMVEAALPLIVGFENIERGDKPLTAGADDVRWFLDLTFPVMGAKRDEKDDIVLSDKGDPVFEFKNNPFAKQVSEFAAEQMGALGNG